jgi:hypothetical protein
MYKQTNNSFTATTCTHIVTIQKHACMQTRAYTSLSFWRRLHAASQTNTHTVHSPWLCWGIQISIDLVKDKKQHTHAYIQKSTYTHTHTHTHSSHLGNVTGIQSRIDLVKHDKRRREEAVDGKKQRKSSNRLLSAGQMCHIHEPLAWRDGVVLDTIKVRLFLVVEREVS